MECERVLFPNHPHFQPIRYQVWEPRPHDLCALFGRIFSLLMLDNRQKSTTFDLLISTIRLGVGRF